VALSVVTVGAARPHYGGTLRVQTQGTIRSIEPAAATTDAADRTVHARILPLVFETLVAPDPAGGLRPLLADAWQREADGVRWRFHVRPGVKLHDTSILQPWHVASALRAVSPQWKIAIDDDTVVIDAGQARPDLPWELASLRYAIAVRGVAGLAGTGPFRVEHLEPPRLTLRAHDGYWAGRPFLDGLQIEMGHSTGDQISSLELARADLVTVQPTDLRRLSQRGLRTAASRPLEVFALVFEVSRNEPSAESIRRTVAASIDRSTLCSVLLQRQGEPASALVPEWLSGYTALLTRGDRGLSRAAVAALPLDQRTLTLRADASDPLAQAIAERIAVDVREAGFTMRVQAPAGLAPRPDVRLVRMTLDATAPDRALAAVMTGLGARVVALATTETAPSPGAPIETVYRIERTLLEHHVVIPVVHVPELYGLGERVEWWNGPAVLPTGAWDLANVWLRTERPDPR
jgi:MarR-like DNA-binding transcriptional regulator SgrR of sgrS sRNA